MNEKQVEVNITKYYALTGWDSPKGCGGPEAHRGAWGLNQ